MNILRRVYTYAIATLIATNISCSENDDCAERLAFYQIKRHWGSLEPFVYQDGLLTGTDTSFIFNSSEANVPFSPCRSLTFAQLKEGSFKESIVAETDEKSNDHIQYVKNSLKGIGNNMLRFLYVIRDDQLSSEKAEAFYVVYYKKEFLYLKFDYQIEAYDIIFSQGNETNSTRVNEVEEILVPDNFLRKNLPGLDDDDKNLISVDFKKVLSDFQTKYGRVYILE